MPYNRPGARFPVAAASRSRLHNTPAVEANYVGIAQKQTQPASGVGFLSNAQITIASGERFTIIDKGVVETAFVATSVPGSTVWINNTNDALTLTDPGGGNGRKFGRVWAIQGTNGIPTGRMLVDLDAKDSF